MEFMLLFMSVFAGVLIGVSATILVVKIRKDVQRNEEAPKRVLVDLLATQFSEVNSLLATTPDEVSVHLTSTTTTTPTTSPPVEGSIASARPNETRTATVRVRKGTKEDFGSFDVSSRPDMWEILLMAASPGHKKTSRVV